MSCYKHPKNKYNQIGILGIEIIGRQNPSLQYGIKDYTISDLKKELEKAGNSKSAKSSLLKSNDNLIINPPKQVDTITGSIIVTIESIILKIQLEKQKQNQQLNMTSNTYSIIKANVKLANKLIDIGHELYSLSVYIYILLYYKQKKEVSLENEKQIKKV